MIPIGHELIRTELRYTEPKLERIDYYATTYECPQCKETEDPRFIKDEDGACSLSNNLSENSIRPLVVGRKNWLFCDTPAGADASMKIYSMIETAKANELDPLKYLSFLLEHCPGAEMSDEELEQFAPWSKLAQETCK